MDSQDYASAIRQVLSFEFCIGEELCTRRLNPKITYAFLSCEPGFVLRIIEYAILTHVRVISMTACESHVKRCPTFPGERQEVHKFCMRHQLRASLQSCLCGVPLPTNDNDVICSELIQHLGLAIAAVRRFEF